MNTTNTANYQVWEGTISNLQVQATHVHYLKNIKQHQKLAGATAIAQAAMNEAGAVVSSQVAIDEGDPVDGFIMNLNGKTVQGSFWKTTFRDGDHVQVIGRERNGVIHAVAVTKPDERIIWMQPHSERGTRAKKKSVLKACAWFILLGYVCALLLTAFTDTTLLFNIVGISISIPVILFATVGLSWRDFMLFAREMNSVGAALGIPEPEKIDLVKSTKIARRMGKPDLPLGVYYY